MRNTSILNKVIGRLPVLFAAFTLLVLMQGPLFAKTKSTLEMSVWNNRPFELTLNGMKYRSQGFLRVDDLRAGIYQVQVTQRVANRYSANGYKVTRVFSGTLRIPAQSKVRAEAGRSKNLIVHSVERMPVAARPGYSGRPSATDCAYQHDHDGNEPFESGWVSDEDVWTEDNEWAYVDEVVRPVAVMDEEEFEDILSRMQESWFAEDRLIMARQAIGDRSISSGQALEMAGTFSFESTKLEFAKFAYLKVYDPERFYILNDAFSFSSSRRELDEYMRSNPRE